LQQRRAAHVRYGSKAEKLDLSIRCPLYPQKRTLTDTTGMSALCQKRTYAPQQCHALGYKAWQAKYDVDLTLRF